MTPPKSLPNKAELRVFISVMLTALAIYFGIDLYIPSMPWIEHSLHTSQLIVQLTVALYTLGAAISVLFGGPLSDKFGRKPLILTGLALLMLGCLVSMLAINGPMLLAGRILQGVGAGAAMGANRAMITDTFSGQRLAVLGAYFSTLIAISPVVAPIVGGYLQHYFSWRANFVVLMIYYIVAFLITVFWTHETNGKKHVDKISLQFLAQRYYYLIRQADFRTYTVSASLILGIPIAYATVGPYILQNTLHLSPVAFGWMGIFIGAGNILGKLASPVLIRKFDMQTTFVVGISVVLLSGALLGLSNSLGYLTVALVMTVMMIALFGQACVTSTAFSLGLSPYRHMGGAANALLSSSQMGFSFVVGGLLSLSSHSISNVSALSGCYIGIGLACLIIFAQFWHKYLLKQKIEFQK